MISNENNLNNKVVDLNLVKIYNFCIKDISTRVHKKKI
jgi:hypothetical protein